MPSRSPGRWPPELPQDDQQVLDFLGIRQRCVEWANASVHIPTGGNYRGHTAAAITDVTRTQPGRGLSNGSHFMVITDATRRTEPILAAFLSVIGQ